MEVFPFISLLFPLMVFGGMFFLFSRLNKFFFKALLSRFELVSEMPKDSIRPEIFRFGNSILRNSMSLAEEGDGIVVKIMLVPAFKIPYASFSSIQQEKNVITFKFKENLNPIYVVFRPGQLEKFPRLKAKLSNATSTNTPSVPALPARQKESYKQEILPPSINTLQIKSTFGNIVRGLILVALLIAAGVYAHNRWGLF